MSHSPRLRLEPLEPRENPAGPVETFDAAPPPGLPAGWAEWSSDGTDAVATAAGQGVGGSAGVVTAGTSRTAARAWQTAAVSATTGAAVSVQLDSLTPTFVFARGRNLDTKTPSYVAAAVTRGATVTVYEVRNGVSRPIGAVASPRAEYLSAEWVRVSLVPTARTVAVEVVRLDTGEYLNSRGVWQAAPTHAVRGTITASDAPGAVGFGRAAAYAGAVRVDDFQVLSPAPAVLAQNFDTTAAGRLPAGWSGWSTGTAGFAAAAGRSVSPANALTSTAARSADAARAWADADQPADVAAAASVYLDTVTPAQVIVRGSNLGTAAPTYYAAVVSRGLEARLVKVVNGVETTLGTVTSDAYFSSNWLRVKVTAVGDRLRLMLYRADTGRWLTPDGVWSADPDYALERTDSSITGKGKVGVGRGAKVTGRLTVDDFEASAASTANGPGLTLTRLNGSGLVTGDVTFRAAVTGPFTRVEFRLGGQVRATAVASPADWTFDSTSVPNGTYTLTVRAFDAAGNLASRELALTVANPNADPLPKPPIPRHYDHIRVAALAYSGNPLGAFERDLLANSVDLVVPNAQYLATIDAVAPDTPQLIYSNVSNLYLNLLTDWLAFADRTGADREAAFYHVAGPTAFTGQSASSQPVTWFWGVYRGGANGAVTDVTAAARGGRNFTVPMGGAGEWTAIGSPDRFRELNLNLARGASAGWGGVWEYVAATDAAGNPTAWAPLHLNTDTTAGLARSGTATFDPPAGWVPSTVGGSARLYYVRFRATAGTAAQAADLRTVMGRDYVTANGRPAGTIPAFDYAADLNRDGHLTDAEYARRAAGKDARFVSETRLFYPYYGQMRFVTNPSAPALRRWAADYHLRALDANPLADGVFLDNATGKVPFGATPVLEPTAAYSVDSGALVAAVGRAIAPRWVMANTAGGGALATPVAGGSAAVAEEFLLRPLDHNWSQVGDVANLVASRLAAPGSPYVVLDSYPAGGSPTDPRTQIGTLAYYYLLADPDRTFLMFYGGHDPASSWTEHWTAAAAVDVGRPVGGMVQVAAGTDPSNPSLSYKVLGREYENARVLYKPLSYAPGAAKATTGDGSATVHQLGGRFRAVQADGTLGPVVTSVTLRNGEGAVLVRA